MQPYLVAHDLGTSGNKASLFTAGGTLVRSVTVPYAPRFFAGDRAEQNPDDWWRAVCEANHRLLEGEDKSRVAGVSFSGQMMGCVPVVRLIRYVHYSSFPVPAHVPPVDESGQAAG